MGFLSNLVKKGISEGISKGISSAVGGAMEKAVTPVAEKWANKTAEGLDAAAGNVEADVKASGSAFDNLKRATENYAAAMEKAAGELGYEVENAEAQVKAGMLEEDGIEAVVKIRKVLAEDFSSYEVKENVSPTTIGGTGKFLNYSFGVYKDGAPKLFIMMVGKNTCSTRLYRFSKEQAAKSGVTMINFISHYPNNVEYIKERLKKYL